MRRDYGVFVRWGKMRSDCPLPAGCCRLLPLASDGLAAGDRLQGGVHFHDELVAWLFADHPVERHALRREKLNRGVAADLEVAADFRLSIGIDQNAGKTVR